MTELVVTRGVPASGKSTWALEWIAESPSDRVRVNRDALRESIYGRPAPLTRDEEETVSVAQRAAVTALLRAGTSVVVDDTHIRAEYIRNWGTLANKLGVAFTVNESFRHVPVEVCVERDVARGAAGERFVGRKVIEDMHQRLRSAPAYTHSEPPPDPYVYEPDDSLRGAWLFDLDGTLAAMDGRGPFEWHRVGEDACNEALVAVAKALWDSGATILIVSGRDACCRDETTQWLLAHRVPFTELLMRPEGDIRKDAIVKLEILRDQIAPRHHVLGVFDDRDQVVEMWRRVGIMCCQVAPGDF